MIWVRHCQVSCHACLEDWWSQKFHSICREEILESEEAQYQRTQKVWTVWIGRRHKSYWRSVKRVRLPIPNFRRIWISAVCFNLRLDSFFYWWCVELGIKTINDNDYGSTSIYQLFAKPETRIPCSYHSYASMIDSFESLEKNVKQHWSNVVKYSRQSLRNWTYVDLANWIFPREIHCQQQVARGGRALIGRPRSTQLTWKKGGGIS